MVDLAKWLDEHEATLKELYAALESAAALEPNIVNILHTLFGHVAAVRADAEPPAPPKKGKAATEASADTAA